MSYEAINFRKKFALFDEQWQPKVIAEMNDYQFKVVKLEGDFIWHDSCWRPGSMRWPQPT
jgi:hypothetical protein